MLLVTGFNNEVIREQLATILMEENRALFANLKKIWTASPINGVSFETWGIFFNAIIDGLAIQALLSPTFSVEKTYSELELLINGLTKFIKRRNSDV